MNSNDALDRAIESALGPGEAVSAPTGFAARVESRLFYAALLERQRRNRRAAAWVGGASLVTFAAVATLFVEAVDLPAWIVQNVPGVLGRLDGLRVGIERSPQVVLAAAGGVLLTACGVVAAAIRTRET